MLSRSVSAILLLVACSQPANNELSDVDPEPVVDELTDVEPEPANNELGEVEPNCLITEDGFAFRAWIRAYIAEKEDVGIAPPEPNFYDWAVELGCSFESKECGGTITRLSKVKEYGPDAQKSPTGMKLVSQTESTFTMRWGVNTFVLDAAKSTVTLSSSRTFDERGVARVECRRVP